MAKQPADAPVWRDGIPANLTAAAMDALEWLRYIEHAQPHPEDARARGVRRSFHLTRENRKRLAAAIEALAANLPDA